MKGRTRFIIGFLSPALFLYGFLVGLPLIESLYYSMFRWRGLSTNMKFVGAKNLVEVAKDDVMHTATINQILLLVCGGIMIIMFAVSIAHALHKSTVLGKSVSAIMLFPQVVSLVVIGIMWQFMWEPRYGLMIAGGRAVGIPYPKDGVLGVAGWANGAILIAFVWHAVGFYVMLFGAGLRNIDTEITEASELDGASGWTRFSRITWPLLWAVKRVAVIYVVSNVMGTFVLVKMMTQSGPDNATQVLLTYMYEKGYTDSQMGQACAIAVYSFVIAMILGMVVWRVIGKNPENPRRSAAI
jgi:N-acetylglucosamine transport system permease protein